MYDFLNKLYGSLTIEVSGALPESFLNSCIKRGIEILSAFPVDSLTMRVKVAARDRKKLDSAAAASSCSYVVLSDGGCLMLGKVFFRRIFPTICMAMLICLLFLSRLFIWDISVEGNETVESGKILEVLSRCGVYSGSFWPALTADLVRSEALMELPELSWLTVNINGSRAQVIVRERVEKPLIVSEDTPADIVAEKTGIIEEVRALIGTEMVQPGQAVVKGETLISGGVESSFSAPRLLHSWGSVTAMTYYELNACIPVIEQTKSYTGDKKCRWSIAVGEHYLNFYRNSSISDTCCDKIYSVWNLGIEGMFRLPISIMSESSYFYELSEREIDKNQAQRELEQTLKARLLESIGEDGEIISCEFSSGESAGLISVCLRARCIEEIGLTVAIDQARVQEIENNYISKGEETND